MVSPLWGKTSESFINPILILQKRVVSTLSNNLYYKDSFSKPHAAPLFMSCKILTIHDIFRLEALKFVFDCVNKLNPSQFHSYFSLSSSTITTASKRDLKLDPPQVRTTTYGLKSLKYEGSILWNDLSLSCRSILSRKQFVKKLRALFIVSYSSE